MLSAKWRQFCLGLNVLTGKLVWEWISNFIPHFYFGCNHLAMLRLNFIHVSKGGALVAFVWYPSICHVNTYNEYCQISNIRCILSRQWHCWSLKCSWSTASWRCSNYIFILDLRTGFNGLGKDNCKRRWKTFRFSEWARLILEGLYSSLMRGVMM